MCRREPLPLRQIASIDAAQQSIKFCGVLEWKCSAEAASPNIEVAPCEQAHRNETFAAHA